MMRVRAAAMALALAPALAGCAAAGPAGQAATDGGGGGGPGGGSTVTVFAAASLKGAFTEAARSFEAENPGTRIIFNFAGSAALLTQITQGAPADVFASADSRTMAGLQDEGLVDGQPRDFATNTLGIVVPPGNPAGVTGFGDLARPGVKVVVCAGQVPCGRATEAIERRTGTVLTPVSEESSVTDVLGKITSGEADAGLVYLTDARSAGGRVEQVPFPEGAAAVNTYPIAAVKGAGNGPAARAFIEFVLGPEGRAALADAGFGKP